MTGHPHPRGQGTRAMDRKLVEPYGPLREAASGTDMKLHRVEVSWCLYNGVRQWRATCGYRTGNQPKPSDLMLPSPVLDRCDQGWLVSLQDPLDSTPSALCPRCYPALAGAA